ncbi:hypothetical protein Vretimale_8678, partial [Volvox reticuliferus]
AAAAASTVSYSPGAHTVPRRLAVTRSWLLERDATTYDVEERRPLGSISALLRFAEEPGLLGVEWTDGAAPSLYMAGAARDGVLAALLDMAQCAAGRPVPVLPGFTPTGDPIVGSAAAALSCHGAIVTRDAETERWCVEQLVARARAAWPHLSNSGRMFYAADIEFSSVSPAPSTLATLTLPTSPRHHQQPAKVDGAGHGQGPTAAPQPPSQPQTGVILSGQLSSATASDTARTAAAVHLATETMLDVVYDFNASVPYAGVAAGTKVDEPTLACVLALLHPELVPGPVPLSHLTPDEAKQCIAALQALQRLVSSHTLAEMFLGLPTAVGRVMAAYACGHDGVAAEAARLLTRLWAPAAARAGAAPWSGLRAAPSLASLLADPDDPLSGCDPEDLSLARSAKALCFGPSIVISRCKALMWPLRGGRGTDGSGSGGVSAAPAAAGSNTNAVVRIGRPPALGGLGASAASGGVGGMAGALLVACALEAVGAVVVEPGCRSTDNRPLAVLLQEAAELGPPLFALCHHPAPRVTQGAALLMRAVAESGAAAAAPMRQAALRHGAVLHHLHAALFAAPIATVAAAAGGGSSAAAAGDGGTASGRQQLGRALVASWCDEYAPALALLRRIFPPGLVRYLNAPRTNSGSGGGSKPAPILAGATAAAPGAAAAAVLPPYPAVAGAAGEASTAPHQQLQRSSASGTNDGGAVHTSAPAAAPGASSNLVSAASTGPAAPAPSTATGTALPDNRAAASTSWGLKGNWEAFWDAATRDHCHAGLIWHAGCRQELREVLEREEAGLRARRQQLGGGGGGRLHLGWNYEEFGVTYPSLVKHVVVGGIYVRLLLEGTDTAAVEKVPQPRELFNSLHHAFLCAADPVTQGFQSAAAAVTAAATSSAVGGAVTDATAAVAAAAAVADAAVTADQELCARAMAAVYHAHAGTIGPTDGLRHLIHVLDYTLCRRLRHALLELVVALLAPRCLTAASGTAAGAAGAVTSPAARAVRANSYAFMEAGGLELLTDLVAYAHTGGAAVEGGGGSSSAAGGTAVVGGWGVNASTAAQRQQQVGAQSGLMLTSVGHDDMPKEWYFYPRGVLPPATAALTGRPSPSPAAAATDDLIGEELPTAAAAAASATDASESGSGSDTLLGRKPDETGRAGPYTRDEVRQLVSRGSVDMATLCWATGMQRPEPLGSIRELRWMLARGPGRFSPYAAAELALQLLRRLVELQPAVDEEEGLVLQPLPRAYRVLAGPRCLPHLCQAILTFHPSIVSATCAILDTLLTPHPDALARLHLTGVFYFALAYPGSDLTAPARLLHRTHLAQDFAGLTGGAAAAAGLPLRQRSYLGHVLPESLLYVLETRGSAAFAAALCGDHDNPELIWTHAMRRSRLLPALSSHLGDLPLRLAQRCGTLWDYSPLPPLSYPELEGELYCHRYYLRHLADTVRFPSWPLVDQVPLLQSLLVEWRAELARQPLSLSEAEACSVLGLRPTCQGDNAAVAISEEELRRAYRALARKYHPDKNPQGRPMFLKIQTAYERLQAGVAGGQGPQPWRIVLLLRAQCVLYGRCSKDLAPYKYAGYGLLLDTIRGGTARGSTTTGDKVATGGSATTNTSTAAGQTKEAPAAASSESVAPGSFFAGDVLDQVTSAAELCWLTVLSCRRNAEELSRCGGVGVLAELLSRAVGVLPLDAAPTDPTAVIAIAALRSLAGLAVVPEARAAMATVLAAAGPSAPAAAGLCRDLVRCCRLTRCHAAVDAALVVMAYMAAAPELQAALLRRGALQALVPLVLQYDSTLPESVRATLAPPFSGPDDSATLPLLALPENAPARSSTPAARSLHAVLAAQALSRLSGLLPAPHSSPPCAPARSALAALLTEPLASRLCEPDPRPLLGVLSGTHETCKVIWNPAMREELLKFLEQSAHTAIDLDYDLETRGQTAESEAQEAEAAGTATATAAIGSDAAGASNDDLLSGLCSFSHAALAGELVVGGVFVRVFNERPSELPPDPSKFCKDLVRYLFDALLPLPPGSLPPASSLPPLLAVLAATGHLLDAEPRLLGVLASRSALSPFVSCLQPAAYQALTNPNPQPQPQQLESSEQLQSKQPEQLTEGWQAANTGPAGAPTRTSVDGCADGPVGHRRPSASGVPPAAWYWANRLAVAGMALLSRVAQHSGCLEAFADEHCARLLFWLLHRPPSLEALTAALRLLRAVSGSAPCAAVAALQGGWLYLLEVLLHRGPWPWQQQQSHPQQQGLTASPEAAFAATSRAPPTAAAAGSKDHGDGGRGAAEAAEAAAVDEARGEAVSLLGRLMAHATHGSLIRLSLQRLLPPGLVASIADGPPAVVLQALTQRVETPECIWDAEMACNAATQVAVLASQLRARQAEGQYDWALPPGAAVQYDKLRGELFVGGAYVRLFLKNPKHPLRNPAKFAEGLLERYLSELASANRDSDLLVLLAAALVALLRSHSLLAEQLCRGGYVSKLLAQLGALTRHLQPSQPQLLSSTVGPTSSAADGTTPSAAGTGALSSPPLPQAAAAGLAEACGSALRILHQLCDSPSVAEAFATASPPVVQVLCDAMQLGPAARVLALEALKRALAPVNRQRDALVLQALQYGLIPELLASLDWQSSRGGPAVVPGPVANTGSATGGDSAGGGGGTGGDDDVAVLRVLAVDVLKALQLEGLHSQQVNNLLDGSAVWQAYCHQRHDLYLPSGAIAQGSVVGLLTAPETARFALPPPEALGQE